MFLSPETLTALIALGAPPEKLAEVLHMIERDAESVRPRRSTGAERQARYRERNAASQNVTGRHEASPVTETLSPSPPPRTPPPRPHTRGNIYTPRESDRAAIAKGFLAFWAAYPRRKAKDAAAKAFERAWKRIDDTDPLAVILAGIERAMPGWDDPNFIPYPASWLNAGSWEDEAPPPRTPARLPNASSDRTALRQANYDAAWSGADGADQVLAARRGY